MRSVPPKGTLFVGPNAFFIVGDVMNLMTVLAIDDDPAQLARLRLLCEAMQYPQIEFLSAETVASGLAIIWDKVIDLVLTDLHLPDGSGLDVLTRTKALNPLIPIVIMTAYSDPKEAVNLLKEGADDYLVKPMDPADIERLILRIHEKNVLIRESFLPPCCDAVAAPAAAGIIYR